MKKILSVLALAAMLLTAVPTQAQVSYGLRAGSNLTNFKLSGDFAGNFDKSNRTGFYVGPTVKFTLPVVGIAVDASALYDYRSVKAEEESLKYQAISVPINVRYGLGLSSVANVFLFAGPQFGFNLSSRYSEWDWKTADISINAGIGCTVASHMELKANYNFACSKSGSFEVGGAETSGRFNTWQVGLAYWF